MKTTVTKQWTPQKLPPGYHEGNFYPFPHPVNEHTITRVLDPAHRAHLVTLLGMLRKAYQEQSYASSYLERFVTVHPCPQCNHNMEGDCAMTLPIEWHLVAMAISALLAAGPGWFCKAPDSVADWAPAGDLKLGIEDCHFDSAILGRGFMDWLTAFLRSDEPGDYYFLGFGNELPVEIRLDINDPDSMLLVMESGPEGLAEVLRTASPGAPPEVIQKFVDMHRFEPDEPDEPGWPSDDDDANDPFDV